MTRAARARLKREAPNVDLDGTRSLVEDVLDEALRANHALATAQAATADLEERQARLQRLATELGKAVELSELGRALADALQKPPFLCESVALSLVDHGAAHAVVRRDHSTPFWSWRHFAYFFAQDCFFVWCRSPSCSAPGLFSRITSCGGWDLRLATGQF